MAACADGRPPRGRDLLVDSETSFVFVVWVICKLHYDLREAFGPNS